MIRTYNQMHRKDMYSQQNSIIWSVWLYGWVFLYEPSGCGFESSCSSLNFRFTACIEEVVPWYSGIYRVWIHSVTRSWHYKNMLLNNLKDRYSQNNSMIRLFWLNDWRFVYEISGCGFNCTCTRLNFRFCDCFEQGLPWHSLNHRECIHSEMRT